MSDAIEPNPFSVLPFGTMLLCIARCFH